MLTDELSQDGWIMSDKATQLLVKKIRSQGVSLNEYVDGRIYYGIKTGLNEAFVIDEETKNRLIREDANSADVIKPFLAGRDIKRYECPESENYLILLECGQTKKWFGDLNESDAWQKIEARYPAIAQHLEYYESKAKKRYDQGDYWWELRACAYYEEFEKGKVMLPDISNQCQALYDDSAAYYCTNTAYIINGLDKSDLGVLNSKLILFFYANITQTIRGGYYRFIRQYLEQIPIIKSDILEDKVDKIITIKKQDPGADTSILESEIDQMVYQLYGLTEEEIEIIEKAIG